MQAFRHAAMQDSRATLVPSILMRLSLDVIKKVKSLLELMPIMKQGNRAAAAGCQSGKAGRVSMGIER